MEKTKTKTYFLGKKGAEWILPNPNSCPNPGEGYIGYDPSTAWLRRAFFAFPGQNCGGHLENRNSSHAVFYYYLVLYCTRYSVS